MVFKSNVVSVGLVERPSGEMCTNRLSDGGIVTTQIARKPDQRKGVNDPFRRIEIVPLRSVAEVTGVGVMKIMIALAETDEGDQPAVAAAVLRTVMLCSHHVTE